MWSDLPLTILPSNELNQYPHILFLLFRLLHITLTRIFIFHVLSFARTVQTHLLYNRREWETVSDNATFLSLALGFSPLSPLHNIMDEFVSTSRWFIHFISNSSPKIVHGDHLTHPHIRRLLIFIVSPVSDSTFLPSSTTNPISILLKNE